MRIVGGKYRGKKLKTPQDEKTRPTSDKARESLFNILSAALLKKGKNWAKISFLDVFAGTGAVGLEALSRGAAKVQLIENHPQALQVIKENIKGLDDIFILSVDATLPPFTAQPVDMVFMDAPYREELWEKALVALQNKGWIDKKTWIIIEIESTEEGLLPAGFTLTDDRTYGRNRLLFCKAA